MKGPVLDFIRVARIAGLPISPAASLDAFRALETIGYDDRTTVHDALQMILARGADERERFDAIFDRFFSPGGFEPVVAALEETPFTSDFDTPDLLDAAVASALAQMLLRDDRATLVRELHAAAAKAGLPEIRVFTQTNAFTRRILELLGIDGLAATIARLRASGDVRQAAAADFLAERGRAVRELARDIVERRLAMTSPEAGRTRDEFLRDARLSNVERRDVERMRSIVRAMARRLAIRYGRVRKHARRGHLDVRRTLRGNMANDGILFRTAWKTQRIERPRIVVLCDVSGSVASLAQFLLLFVHSLSEEIADIRSFAFSGILVEVTEIMRRRSIDDAILEIMALVGFRSSDYGHSFEDFERGGWLSIVDRKTTVVILGDGRTNYANPRTDIVRKMAERAKRLVWLNPENRVAWGMGDSEMLAYLPHCSVAAECNRLRHLERVVDDLLKTN